MFVAGLCVGWFEERAVAGMCGEVARGAGVFELRKGMLWVGMSGRREELVEVKVVKSSSLRPIGNSRRLVSKATTTPARACLCSCLRCLRNLVPQTFRWALH